MAGGVSGFAHAPITKLLVVGSVSLSLLTQSWRASHAFSVFRVLSSCVVFHGPGDLTFGGGLLYHTRLFERLKGSRAHGSALLTCGLLSVALQLLSSWVFALSPRAPSLPCLAIYSFLVPFLTEVPALSHFRLFGWQLSDKAFVFLCAVELLYLARDHSLTSSLCSLIAGLLYHSNMLGLKGLLIPEIFCQLCDRTFGKLLHSPPPQLRGRQTGNRGGTRSGGTVGEPANTAMQAATVSPAAVEQLTAMGFSLPQAETALRHADGDMQMALALLLSQD